MKLEVKVETGNPVDTARHLRLCAATLRHHGAGKHGVHEFAEAVARSLELEAERLQPLKDSSGLDYQLSMWGF